MLIPVWIRTLSNLPHKRVLAAIFMLAGLGVGGCAQSPQQLSVASHGKEYFPSSVYGSASRRVVADGQPIPRGGGQYLVGRPYTIAGQTYYPSERKTVQVGIASWYGDAFHGRKTANGEVYDRNSFTAAHPTMPLPSYARVTNLDNKYSMIVRVNDRGPYAANRIMDVSGGVADALDFKRTGTAKVKVEYIGPASLSGSDDTKLYATLRQDGPAHATPSMMAEAAPAPTAEVASLASYAPQPAPRPMAEISRPTSRIRATYHDTIADLAADARAARFARTETTHVPARIVTASAAPVLPPSRPLDLGTIPGAASQIGMHHGIGLRMSRSHDDD